MKPGWPVEVGKDGVGGGPVEAPDGNVLLLTFSYDDAGVISYQLRRFYPDGTPADGWPYLFDKGTDCAGPVLDATGNAVVVCGSDAGSRMVAIDPNGDAAWDTDLPTVRNATGLQRGDDGSLYVVSASGDGLMAVGPTGLIPDGWPVEAGDGAGIMATPTGLLAWWHVGADQDICQGGGTTVYTILGPDGAPAPAGRRRSSATARNLRSGRTEPCTSSTPRSTRSRTAPTAASWPAGPRPSPA